MNKILIEVIITNQCNKRCDYCDLDFGNKSITDENIDIFTNFINSNFKNYFHINFFGGEPLLKFDKIKKIISKINAKNIKYSIGTNGNLLNNEILEFLYRNNVNISLSVDNITGLKNIYGIDNKYFKLIEINFINDPDFLFNSEKIFLDIIKYGFNNINFMPVFTTKKWGRDNIIKLGKLVKNIKIKILTKDINIKYFGYFNGISSDKQFVLDTDGYFYNDLDSLLWLQKQYSILGPLLKEKINNYSKNIDIKKISLKKLLTNYNIENIINLVMEVPKKKGNIKDYRLIDKIIKNGNN